MAKTDTKASFDVCENGFDTLSISWAKQQVDLIQSFATVYFKTETSFATNLKTMKGNFEPVHNTDGIAADDETSELQSPGLLRRLATLIYDGVLLVCLEIVVALPLPAVPEDIRNSFGGRMAIFAGMMLVAYLFVGYCWTHGGQTLGERAWRVRVIAQDGSAMTWGLSLKRLLLGLPSLLAGGLGYLWAIVDRDGQTWHDRLSGSRAQYYGKTKNTGS